LVAGLGLISVLAAMVFVAYLAVTSLGGSLSGGSAGDAPSGGGGGGGGAADSVVLRLSGTPGVKFSGSYTTPAGSQNVSGTLGAAPTDYDLGGKGIAGVNVVSANVKKQPGKNGVLKVEVLKNGQVVQSQETNAASDTVSVTASP
jgi:hypothetical protein